MKNFAFLSLSTLLAVPSVTYAVFYIPVIAETSSTSATIKFVAKLTTNLPTGYRVKIDYGNGKGLTSMTCLSNL